MDVGLAAIWSAAGVLAGLQITAFTLRINREIAVSKDDDLTWLPIADVLNLLSLLVIAVAVFVAPVLGFGGEEFAKKAFGLAVLLLVGYAFALAGHYDMYNRHTSRSRNRDGSLRYSKRQLQRRRSVYRRRVLLEHIKFCDQSVGELPVAYSTVMTPRGCHEPSAHDRLGRPALWNTVPRTSRHPRRDCHGSCLQSISDTVRHRRCRRGGSHNGAPLLLRPRTTDSRCHDQTSGKAATDQGPQSNQFAAWWPPCAAESARCTQVQLVLINGLLWLSGAIPAEGRSDSHG